MNPILKHLYLGYNVYRKSKSIRTFIRLLFIILFLDIPAYFYILKKKRTPEEVICILWWFGFRNFTIDPMYNISWPTLEDKNSLKIWGCLDLIVNEHQDVVQLIYFDDLWENWGIYPQVHQISLNVINSSCYSI